MQDHGLILAHMDLAFVRQQPFTTSLLISASPSAQFEENFGAVDVSLSKELINAIHAGGLNPR